MNAYGRWVLVASILGSGLVFLDSTIVTVALPRIGQDLPTMFLGVLEGQSYVYNGYLLTLSGLLILAGAANDHFGRRRMFQLGITAFGVTSVLCALAPNMESLIAFRILQGAAGALLVPSSLSLITASFEGEERGRAFGYWSGASAATTILGPVVGGLLVDSLSWRAAFLINVPFVIAALAATRPMRESRDDASTGRFDWVGSLICAVAVGGIAFGLIYGQQREWRDVAAFVAIALGLAALVALPVWMSRATHPLVPLSLFGSRNFAVTNVSTFLIYGALYVTFYYLALFMQGVLGYTAAGAGIAGLPATLLLVLFSSRVGGLAARRGSRPFMVGGPLVMAAGVATFAFVPATATPWRFGQEGVLPPADYLIGLLPGLLVFGAGLTLMVTPLVTTLMGSVPVERSGLASAINNAISRIGPQLLGALLFVVLTASFYSELERRTPDLNVSDPEVRQAVSPLNPPKLEAVTSEQMRTRHGQIEAASREASTNAFHLAMLLGAGLLVAGALVNLAIQDVAGPERADEQVLAAD